MTAVSFHEIKTVIIDARQCYFSFKMNLLSGELQSNSFCYVDNLYDPFDSIVKNRANVYFFIRTLNSDSELYCPLSLIDNDYPTRSYITIYNPSDKKIDLAGKSLILEIIKRYPIEQNIDSSSYRFPYLNCINRQVQLTRGGEDNRFTLVKNTNGAAGYDMKFLRDFEIKARGILSIIVENAFSCKETELSPLQFLTRSRFGRQGVEVYSIKPESSEISKLNITLTNNSSSLVYLGDTFIQYVPILDLYNKKIFNCDCCLIERDRKRKVKDVAIEIYQSLDRV